MSFRCFLIISLFLPVINSEYDGFDGNYYAQLREMLKLTSGAEVADQVIDDLMKEYPMLHVSELEEVYAVKREFAEYLEASQQKQMKVLAGFPLDEYSNLAWFFEILRDITYDNTKSVDHKDKLKEVMSYLKYILQIKPIIDIGHRNMLSFKERGFDKEDRDDEREAKKESLLKLWNSLVDSEKPAMTKEDL
ncbi:hypothetical protein PFISCL1PPCAC_19016 [Pristionchus fissidentatus]|uniref:Uncharacterized protein n=1 Tax=Pristionchus fissidentatus TaxID=1538716 RepID=A0AAV5WAE8_9BILA|nr:hypothetical protein PFISCL1PPCAC_19016 [Pristionchus fissidentatus]